MRPVAATASAMRFSMSATLLTSQVTPWTSASAASLAAEVLEGDGVEVAEHQGRAGLGEAARDRRADAAGGPSHDHRLAAHVGRHALPPVANAEWPFTVRQIRHSRRDAG